MLVAAAIVTGIAIRIWILASPLGTLESDEAIVGLMARRALHGDFNVLYWLSYYGGTQEALLTALVFAVFGSSVLALKLTALALFAVDGVLLWRVGVRTVGEPAARLGAALFWIGPAYLVWWTTKARAYYATGLLCELVVMLMCLRLRERDSRLDAAILGFALGFGAWATLQFALGALPIVAWLVWRRPHVLRLAWIAVPAAIVGAAPWLAWNVKNDWKGLLPSAVAGEGTTFAERLWNLFSKTLPTWLGLRVPFSLDWLLGVGLGVVLLAAALAAFAYALVRHDRRLEPLLVVGAAFPFLYAATSFTYYVAEPRYLVYLAPVTSLLLAYPLRRAPVAGAALAVATLLTLGGLIQMERQRRFLPGADGAPMPYDIGPLVSTLERDNVRYVVANYWIAYRLSFETDERVLATSSGFVRDLKADAVVRAQPHPAHVFVRDSPVAAAVGPRLARSGFRRVPAGGFVVYEHD
jgi:hypothetical protein